MLGHEITLLCDVISEKFMKVIIRKLKMQFFSNKKITVVRKKFYFILIKQNKKFILLLKLCQHLILITDILWYLNIPYTKSYYFLFVIYIYFIKKMFIS